MITNYEKSVSIYETGGQYAVYKAVEKGHLCADSWQKCLPCEDKTPHEVNICLVCGTQQEI